MITALTIKSINTPAPAHRGDGLVHELTKNLSTLSVRHRFYGKSSGAMLVKAAVQLREGTRTRKCRVIAPHSLLEL
jgi:hypothetical protein